MVTYIDCGQSCGDQGSSHQILWHTSAQITGPLDAFLVHLSGFGGGKMKVTNLGGTSNSS